MRRNNIYLLLVFCIAFFLNACQYSKGRTSVVTSGTHLPAIGDSTILNRSAKDTTAGKNAEKDTVSADEILFDRFFSKFKNAVKHNDEKELEKMIRFPFETGLKWEDRDVKYNTVDKQEGLVLQNEFHQYYKDIFNADVRRLIPKCTEEDITEMYDVRDDDYYSTLQSLTDKGSPMYEVYAQWTFSSKTYAGSYFGFVFGKVNGEYRALSYYGKWSVKD